jgi:hypothetical protein
MKGVRDWVFGQLLSKSLASTRPLSGSGSFLSEEPVNEDSDDPGAYFYSLATIELLFLLVTVLSVFILWVSVGIQLDNYFSCKDPWLNGEMVFSIRY